MIPAHCTKHPSDLEGVASLNPSKFQHTACFRLPCLFSHQPHPKLQLVQWLQVVAQCHGWDIAQRGLWVLGTKSSPRTWGPQGHLPLSLCSFYFCHITNQEPVFVLFCFLSGIVCGGSNKDAGPCCKFETYSLVREWTQRDCVRCNWELKALRRWKRIVWPAPDGWWVCFRNKCWVCHLNYTLSPDRQEERGHCS